MSKMSDQWGWHKNPDGTWEMPENKARFLEWLTTPPEKREPSSQQALAKEMDLHPQTLTNWKQDPTFRQEWDRALAAMNIRPDRVQEVVESLHKQAVRGDTKAAQLYLTMVEKISPPKIIFEEKGVQAMSDEELDAALEAKLAERGRNLRAV